MKARASHAVNETGAGLRPDCWQTLNMFRLIVTEGF